MPLVLTFSIALLIAVLLSELSDRSILSSAVIFLVSGFLVGGVFHVVNIRATEPIVSGLADLALFWVLFTDGMKAGIRDVLRAWRLPGRALFLGLPLTLLITALLAHFVAGLDWLSSLLVGAVLSPTDPVFASAIVGREEIPTRLRHLLNVESGLNDGLALPIVLVLLNSIASTGPGFSTILEELGLGVAVGVGVTWFTIKVEQSRVFAVARTHESLFAFAVGTAIFSVSVVTHANEYLAAFSAGIAIATLRPDLHKRFREFGNHLTELLKLAAVLVFGALISPEFLSAVPWQVYAFAVLALIAVRPIALWISFLGTRLDWREKIAAFWFGPKGFASVVYGLLLLKSDIPKADFQFHLVAIVIAFSILAHSSTDVVVARWFKQCPEDRNEDSLRQEDSGR